MEFRRRRFRPTNGGFRVNTFNRCIRRNPTCDRRRQADRIAKDPSRGYSGTRAHLALRRRGWFDIRYRGGRARRREERSDRRESGREKPEGGETAADDVRGEGRHDDMVGMIMQKAAGTIEIYDSNLSPLLMRNIPRLLYFLLSIKLKAFPIENFSPLYILHIYYIILYYIIIRIY